MGLANGHDSVHYPSDGHVFPSNASDISIKKQTISFECKGQSAAISKYIEFFNPSNSEINQRIRLKAQTLEWNDSTGSDDKQIEDYIPNFKGANRNEILPFQLTSLVDFTSETNLDNSSGLNTGISIYRKFQIKE